MDNITYSIKCKVFAQYIGNKCAEYKDELYFLDGIRDIYYNDDVDMIQNVYLTDSHDIMRCNKFTSISKCKLILTPIKDISHDDIMQVAKICHHDYVRRIKKYDEYIELEIDDCNDLLLYYDGRICTTWRENVSCKDVESEQQLTTYLKCIDFLRSKGYALPYMEYSVDDLVKLNIYKLK